MPSAAARRLYEDQIPSFMSVFDLEADTIAEGETVTLVDTNMVDTPSKPSCFTDPSQPSSLGQGGPPSDPTHRHHDSTSTQMSESTESSPTTTLSTSDSSPLSDPSPSSSPDSPIHLIPLNDYPSTTFGCRSGASQNNMLCVPESRALDRPMTSPAPRRPRNMKGLSIQPPLTISTSSKYVATEPSSPSFIKPKIPATKRKPSQLSLKTGASDLAKKTSLEVPASSALPPILQRRALKHSTSSPHIFAAMKSSTFGPPGGMTFPKVLERNESGLSEMLRPTKQKSLMDLDDAIVEEDSPIKTQLASLSDYKPFHEAVHNEDQKSPGYPDGPIAMYGDRIFLYLEPTAEEASRFDVVINVAREVRNPFEAAERISEHASTPENESPIPDTAATMASFTTAFEYQLTEDSSIDTPTTPKANPLHVPEYIHIPWDHNTDIAPDLMHLCETIENRAQNGKKVLIHCQQGASRSASLIIAYGLYQSPDLSVNDAYYAAQAKSRWISPNMKLMYSLQDFHKEVAKKKRSPSSSAHRPRTGRSPTKHRLTLSADAIDITSKEPHTAPLPGEDISSEAMDSDCPSRPRGNSTPSSQTISPGPASAPLSYSWKEHCEDPVPEPSPSIPSRPFEPALPHLQPLPAVPTGEAFSPRFDAAILAKPDNLPRRPKTGLGRPEPIFENLSQTSTILGLRSFDSHAVFSSFPLRKFQKLSPRNPIDGTHLERTVTVSRSHLDETALLSPRAEVMTTNPLHDVHEVAGMRFVESPPTPTEGLFSPRESSFPSDPFSFFGRMMGFSRPAQAADPRSPPTRGEAPIIRSIDELLQ
ncbi:Dual specificity phosphatase, catalytic domain protein [Metarhizium album ARSEF 1941]|uniref:protein-tyrosine-phosphatase n=1 Tax=Metarhizium album (strain ARSEF 1941) TaxID=1081103 RepID=A0A0B2WRV7_METAS|nr:Dual specificity phosphatase, catalytic domain protein [Metarhizium album ARSEF 1941]KHN96232.1 Dual specificity phosphatase, catalytic domain protein [Metarhizium album ARSEF 1941]